jgi:3-hydroxy-9,10-secoandrosta-1,3,5(10)-triene-9,17-dione monooxygenase
MFLMNSAISTYAMPSPVHQDWLSTEELAALTPDVLHERAREIGQLAATFALEAEQNRQPADAVIDAVRKSGLIYHFVPNRFGGLEYDLQSFIDIILAIGEGCASSAWVTSFYIQHNFLLTQLPMQAQEEIFGQFPYFTAVGTGAPPGDAVPVAGGYRISGHWKYGSGSMHADWAQLMAAVRTDVGPARIRMFMLPMSEVEIVDTWQVDGLAASGSNDLIVKDLFVPEHRSADFEDMRAGQGLARELYDNPMYAIPIDVLLNISSSAPGIGAARGCVRFFQKRLVDRAPRDSAGQPQVKSSSLMRLGEATVTVETAETLLRDAADRVIALAKTGRLATSSERIRIRSQIAYAVELARKSVRIIAEGAGSSAHALSNPIQRALRDLNMMSSHAVYDKDSMYELVGKALASPDNESLSAHHSVAQIKARG